MAPTHDTLVIKISSHCNSGTCVGVAKTRKGRAIIDTKNPTGGRLDITDTAMAVFLHGIRVNRYQETP